MSKSCTWSCLSLLNNELKYCWSTRSFCLFGILSVCLSVSFVLSILVSISCQLSFKSFQSVYLILFILSFLSTQSVFSIYAICFLFCVISFSCGFSMSFLRMSSVPSVRHICLSFLSTWYVFLLHPVFLSGYIRRLSCISNLSFLSIWSDIGFIRLSICLSLFLSIWSLFSVCLFLISLFPENPAVYPICLSYSIYSVFLLSGLS